MRRPDGRAYERARSIGAWAIEDAEALNRPPLAGQYQHDLGTFALDAYCANFGPAPDYPDQIEAWLQKALHPMPSAVDGLTQARAYLTDAIPLRAPGSDLGRTLKALLETEVYLAFAKRGAPDAERVSALAEQALAELDPDTDGPHIARARQLDDAFGAG